MRLRNISCLLIAILSAPALAANLPIRAPAKRYGSIYSVKITLYAGEFSYSIPVWVRPDQKESTLDPGQMALLGWKDKAFYFDRVKMSGTTIPIRRFDSAHSDFAVVPDYPKNCCMGTLGWDVLKHYSIRFDPGNPPFLLLKKQKVSKDDEFPVARMNRVKNLFSLKSEILKWSGKNVDFGETEFDLNPLNGEVIIKKPETAEKHFRKTPLFTFEFLPRTRFLAVKGFKRPSDRPIPSALRKKGLVVTDLDDASVSVLDRFEIEDYLKGKKAKVLPIRFSYTKEADQKWQVQYNFEKDEFSPVKPVPSPARRH